MISPFHEHFEYVISTSFESQNFFDNAGIGREYISHDLQISYHTFITFSNSVKKCFVIISSFVNNTRFLSQDVFWSGDSLALPMKNSVYIDEHL